MLHGRLLAERQGATRCARFAAGEIDVLVSTTVIEVGVDVANATDDGDPRRRPVRRLPAAPDARTGRPRRPPRASACWSPTPRPAPRPASGSTRSPPPPTASSSPALDLEQRREGDVLGASQSGRRSRPAAALRAARTRTSSSTPARSPTAMVAADPDLTDHPTLRRAGAPAATSPSRPTTWRRREPGTCSPRGRARRAPALGTRRSRMTRIIGGTAGGRRIKAPTGDRTRPTSDRVREALFSRSRLRARIAGRPALPRPVRRSRRRRPRGALARCRGRDARRARPADGGADPRQRPHASASPGRGGRRAGRPRALHAPAARAVRRGLPRPALRRCRSGTCRRADLGALLDHGWLAAGRPGGGGAVQPRRAAGLARGAGRRPRRGSTARPCFGTVTQQPPSPRAPT